MPFSLCQKSSRHVSDFLDARPVFAVLHHLKGVWQNTESRLLWVYEIKQGGPSLPEAGEESGQVQVTSTASTRTDILCTKS